jgi:hypothetical protein
VPALPTTAIPKAALLTLVQTLSGVQAKWRTDPEFVAGMAPGVASSHAWIWLSVTSTRAIGVDDYRQVFNAAMGNLDSQIAGNRMFTLSLRAESYDVNIEAFDLVEAVRVRLRSFKARGIFAPAGLALVDIQPTAVFTNVITDAGTKRTLKVAVMDIRWAYVSTYSPTADDDAGGTIDTVDGGTIPGTLVP